MAKRLSLRLKLNEVKKNKCKNLIAVLENPMYTGNLGAIIRNINALGATKVYIVDSKGKLPQNWQKMRKWREIIHSSAWSIKRTYVKVFKNSQECMNYINQKGYVNIATSPHPLCKNNMSLREADFSKYQKIAIWFWNEWSWLSNYVIQNSDFCIKIPMFGIVESLNLAVSAGIVLYEIIKQKKQKVKKC